MFVTYIAFCVHCSHMNKENNDVTGGIPTELGRLRSLKALNLNNNIFTGAIPSEMGNLPEVKHLSVGKQCMLMKNDLTLHKLTKEMICLIIYSQTRIKQYKR